MKYLDESPNISRIIIENFIEQLRHVPLRKEIYQKIISLIKLSVKYAGELIVSDVLNCSDIDYDYFTEQNYDEFEEYENYNDFEDIFK